MLSWRIAGGHLLAGALVFMALPTSQAVADPPGSGGVECPPLAPDCEIDAVDPGHGGGETGDGGGGEAGGGSGGGSQVCKQGGETVPCHRPELGWFNSADGCYWELAEPQPPKSHPIWDGNDDGAIYNVACLASGAELAGGLRWSAAPPPGFGGGVDPAVLAQEAVEKLPLRGADIGIAPKPGKTGLVGLPTWMWNTPSDRTAGPISASATAGAVTVTATARVSKIVWDMGDGSSVTCTRPGTPYKAAYGKRESPDCGHVYSTTSRGKPGNKFHVTATSTWDIHWTGGGQEGDLTATRTSETDIAIGELQVLGR